MKNYETKHLYMASALIALVAMPLVLLVGPFILQGIFFDSTSVFLLQTPVSSRWIFAFSCIALAIFLILAAFFSRFAPLLTVVGALFCLLLIGAGTYNYQYLSQEEISWSEPLSFKVNTYAWDEIEEVILHVPEEKQDGEKEKHRMEFIFQDGSTVSFIRDIEFTDIYHYFSALRRQHNFKYSSTNNM
ncbi:MULTISPECIES: hypothetical protein [Sutcliffiella]|uniref:Uncharacterized protein n=1 Tax=Sutcliffiella cohnii TaxID=33932 RepID=A0A223KXH0_9BACI|nr:MULTISPECIES: hypothetical protein [Sutcliffiella]AST94107.1 hypothetical protein BC6307_24075 [Sutcliffiella cohnii]MED4017360.1 hypothetical protein [Sutcliffiella cohnii]WBL15320.1 hypothetical protein O1A01_01180 [Sutcliffiella sp. NC1]